MVQPVMQLKLQKKNGTIHIPSEIILHLASALFTGLLRIGFRNIYVIIHHQSENFSSGMPTDLAFKLAAKQAIFEFLEKNLEKDGGEKRGKLLS